MSSRENFLAMIMRASAIKTEKMRVLGREVATKGPILVFGEEDLLEQALYSLVAENLREESRKVLIVTFRDYHEGAVLDTYSLSEHLLGRNIDPVEGLKRVFVATIYNVRQALSFNYLGEARRLRVDTIFLYRLTELFPYKSYPLMIEMLGKAKDVLSLGVSLIILVAESRIRRTVPDGPIFLRHFASQMLRVRKRRSYIEVVNFKDPADTPNSLFLERSSLERVRGWF